MAQLDRKRDFATIHGDDPDLKGKAFEQDGKFFDAEGEEWVDPKERKGKTPAAPAPTPAPGGGNADQVNAQLKG